MLIIASGSYMYACNSQFGCALVWPVAAHCNVRLVRLVFVQFPFGKKFRDGPMLEGHVVEELKDEYKNAKCMSKASTVRSTIDMKYIEI